MKLKLKNRKYWIFHYELFQEYKLTSRAKEVFSFLYTHCVNYHDDGWCGYSNERLAEIMQSSTDYVKRGLKELVDKELIMVENVGKRTKRPGESRQIFINGKNFIAEENSEQGNTDNKSLKLIEQLKKDNEELKKENSRLKLECAQSIHITELGHSLIRTGFINEEQYQKQVEELNHILLDFESWHKGGRELSKACFAYWSVHKDAEVKNYVKYTIECIRQSKKWINSLDERDEEDYEERLQKNYEKWVTEKNE